MRMIRMSAVVATALLAVACGSNPVPTITIEAKPSKVQIGKDGSGNARYVTISVRGTINGQSNFPEGLQPAPHITTDFGSFEQLSDPSDDPTQEVDGTVSGGAVTLKLYAPSKPGVASVTASVVDAYGTKISAKTTVTFTAPLATVLNFDCRSKNIGVLADPSTNFALACDASALDENSTQVKSANIRFMAEAGLIQKSDQASGDLPNYVYYPRKGERLAPKDVTPFPGEPSIMEGQTTKNPRDQLVTLVAYVEGNNVDTGDMYSGDPFVDMNDNKTRDADEPFFSVDGSGTYSPSQSSVIWRQVKIVWSGALSQVATIAKCSVVGGTGASADLTRTGTTSRRQYQFTLLDDYYNVLAVNSHDDLISWQLMPSGLIDFDAGQLSTTSMKYLETGLELDGKANFPSATTASSFTRNSQYTVKAYNARTMDDVDGPKPYTVSGTLQRTLTIDDSGEPSNSISSETLPGCGGSLQ